MKKAGGKKKKAASPAEAISPTTAPPPPPPLKKKALVHEAPPPPPPPVKKARDDRLTTLQQLQRLKNLKAQQSFSQLPPISREASRVESADEQTESLRLNFLDSNTEAPQKGEAEKPSLIDRIRLFDQHEIQQYFPLEKMKDAFLANTERILSISLVGVDQLTDMFFLYVDAVYGKDTFLNYIETVVISGCSHLTDLSLQTIVKMFPNLVKITLKGCRNITNRGLSMLRSKLHGLQNIDATGCKVSILLPLPKSRSTIVAKVAGCPLLSPPYANTSISQLSTSSKHGYYDDLLEKPEVAIYRALVVTCPDLDASILNVLGASDQKKKGHFSTGSYKCGDGSEIHMIECSASMVGALSRQRTLYILPVNQAKSFMHNLIQRMTSILLMDPDAVFGIIGVSDDDSSAKNIEGSKDLILSTLAQTSQGSLLHALNKTFSEVINHVARDLKSHNFHMQQVFANLRRLSNGLNDDLASRIHVCGINISKGKQASDSLDKCIQEALPVLQARNESYTHLPNQFLSLINDVPKVKAMQQRHIVAEALRKKHSVQFGTMLQTYFAALDAMEILGQISQLTVEDETYVVTDKDWFGEIVSLIVSSATTNIGNNIFYIHPDTNVIFLPDLHAQLKEKFQSEEQMKLGVDIVRKAFKLGIIDGDWLILLDQLTDQPPVPFEPYVELTDETPSAKITYNFDVPLPETVISHVFYEMSHITEPFLMWNGGMIIQGSPVQSMIKFIKQKTKGLLPQWKVEILVTGIVTGRPTPKNLKHCMADYLIKSRLVLEYVLEHHHLSYTYSDNFKFTMEFSQASGMVNELIAEGKNLTGPHPAVSDGACKQCGEDMLAFKRLWGMRSELWPQFCTPGIFSHVGSSTNLQQQGTWFGIPPTAVGAASGFRLNNELDAYSQSRAEITIMTGPAEIILGITNTDGSTEDYRARKGEEGKGGYDGLTAYEYSQSSGAKETKAMTPDSDLEQGRVIVIAILPYTEENNKVRFIAGGEIMMEGLVKESSNIVLRIVSEAQSGFLFHFPQGAGFSEVWEIGMRLEATDRLNPNLICAATVDDIKYENKEVKQILIHFDGWTSRYDYWTAPDAKDIHPIGFTRQKGHLIEYRKLEAPHGYRQKFTWETYLDGLPAKPVPFGLFSQEQTLGCEPMDYSGPTSLPLGTTTNSCHGSIVTQASVKKNVKITQETMSTSDKWWTSMARKFPLAIPLPKSLSMKDLVYPKLLNVADQSFYVLCGNNGYSHLVNVASIDIDKTFMEKIALANVTLTNVLLMLLNQNHILPMEMSRAIKDVEDVPLDKLESAVKHVLFNHIGALAVLAEYKSTPKEDEPVYQEVCRAVIDKGMREHDLSEHLKVDGNQIYWCAAHSAAFPGQGLAESSILKEVPMEQMKNHYHLTTVLKLSDNAIQELPSDLFKLMPQLQDLEMGGNKLSSLPSFQDVKKLTHLDVAKNQLTSLPGDIDQAPLERLNISGNDLGGIPDAVYKISSLTHLDAANVGLTNLGDSIKNLTKLEELNIQGHSLATLPIGFGDLSNLKKLNISGIPWFNQSNTRIVLSREAFDDFMASNPLTAKIERKEKDVLFNGEGAGQVSTIDHKAIVRLNSSMFHLFSRLADGEEKEGSANTSNEEEGGGESSRVIDPIFKLTNLTDLSMSYLGFKVVPNAVSSLGKLQNLDISHNPLVQTISSEVGVLPELSALHLEDCTSLKTPPKEIVRRGYKAIMGYLRRLKMGSVSCKRTKLMMVGLGGAGKTSTMQALMSKQRRSYGDEFVTDGIDILTWKVCYDNSKGKENEVTYSVWDFAGQTVYYNTHQFFLSNRAIYLLMWNVRLGHEHAGLDFWLSSISCHAPKAPILVIGTHIDQVEKFWLPAEEFSKRYPQIVGFHSVSSYTGDGIDKLAREIYDVSLKEKYMGEQIPQAWLNMEELIVKRKTEGASLLEWKELETIAESTGIVDPMEEMQAVRFLHDLGSIQHFDNDFLRSKVVINPQWIVNVMSCVVSVHENAIKDGKFYHKDVGKIWSAYDESLHQWLLKLTEVFDLTFPLHNEKANLVACLLPDVKPEFEWEDISEVPGQHETKMIYKFEYLPAGLFNRAQVRLHQYADDAVLWKKGSLLHKSGHQALMKTMSGSRVEVRVQGACPENFLFLVHEVYETLIAEAYNGVSYDFSIPCNDCIKAGTNDPCMFEASKIRRAAELKVPFLQCDKYFHTLSMTEIHAMMPPDSSADFDSHLERSIRDLKDLRSDMETDVFMFYCKGDVPSTIENKKVAPKTIFEDLSEAGFKVWYTDNPDAVNLKSIAMTMKNSDVVLVLVSDKFVMDNDCCNVFYYAKNTLHKRLQIIVLGGNQWPKSDIGLQMASEVYVKMDDTKRYVHKKPELVEALGSKTKNKEVIKPECFISYCWSNSVDAIKKGSRKMEGALGWGDPREFKTHLEKAGITCWMDIEQVGQGGLFEDIATGLRHAKVIVACVSDEYAKSKNCQMELRFAVTTLKLPLIVVVVGTGYKWEATEVGMLTLGFPKISCQYESASAIERIVSSVKTVLPEERQDAKKLAQQKNDEQQKAYQELLELAQRKFLRQANAYAVAMDTAPFPRLFFLDFATKNDKDKEGNPILKPEEEDKEKGNDGDLRTAKYVARILCEHDQGWHVPGACIPIPPLQPSEVENQLDTIGPFAARIMALLKHTSLDFPVLNTEQGEKLRAKFEESCALDTDFQEEYTFFRSLLMELDESESMGGLTRCHLPNGMVVWLCEEHRKADPNISRATEETATVERAETMINLDTSLNSKKTKMRGKWIGAGAAAAMAGTYAAAPAPATGEQEKECSVM